MYIETKYNRSLDKTVEELTGLQNEFFENTQAIIQRSKQALLDIENQAGDEARRTLQQADILAYETSYSLPCRIKRPRIVSINPEELIVNEKSPFIKIRGNFFYIKEKPEIFVDGVKAKATISSQEIAIQIPNEILDNLTQEKLVTIQFTPYQTVKVWGRPWCWTKSQQMEQPLEIGLKLLPQVKYEVSGYIEGYYEEVIPEKVTYEDKTYTPKPPRARVDGPDDCDQEISRIITHFIDPNLEIISAQITPTSVGGQSQHRQLRPQDNEIKIEVIVKGLGYEVDLPFGIEGACKGSGWYEYIITVVGRKTIIIPEQIIPKKLSRETFNITGEAGQKTFTNIHHTQANKNLSDNTKWYYHAEIRGTIGRRKLSPVQIDSNNSSAGSVRGIFNDGKLSVKID